MKDLREYPRTRFRRAWIVITTCASVMQFNGVDSYRGCSYVTPGEVFLDRRDAEFVKREEVRLLETFANRYGGTSDAEAERWLAKSREVRIQPIMIPHAIGPSEHVRALRIMKKESK